MGYGRLFEFYGSTDEWLVEEKNKTTLESDGKATVLRRSTSEGETSYREVDRFGTQAVYSSTVGN